MEHFSKNTINERVGQTIEDLLVMHLDGCITGSCVLGNDFSVWETEPDVDFFAYSDTSWVFAVTSLLSNDRYKPGSQKDRWKLDRLSMGKHKIKNRNITQTIYIEDTHTGIYINMSYKPYTSNITDVLSRFDTIAIMVGICCRTQVLVDLRHAFKPMYEALEPEYEGHANPIRLWYMSEGWDETTWSRELARILKYKARGFDMNKMAEEMLLVASRVLERGEVIGSEKSKTRYLNMMMSCYRPVVWLETFLGIKQSDQQETISDLIFEEIKKLIGDLPEDIQNDILEDLSEPLIPSGDKEFEPEDDEEEEEVDDR